MLFRLFSALLRAGIVFFVIVLPSSVLASPEVAGNGAFVIFALLVSIVIFFEYSAQSPSLIEFRYAPPYNRYRLTIFAIVSIVVIAILSDGSRGGAFYSFARGIGNMSGYLMSGTLSPVNNLSDVLSGGNAELDQRISNVASGALFVGFISAIVFSITMWLQRWPLGNAGFNLWPNMPSFHASAGHKTETRMVQIAILSLGLATALPYVFPMVVALARNLLSFEYRYTPHSAFWIIVAWAMIPTMAVMRALVLLKVAYLAKQMRSMRQG